MDFRDAVKYLRGELGLTQVELATALKINTVTVGRWEHGKSLPNRALSAALLDYARARGASKACIKSLEHSISTAAKNKIDSASDTLYIVEHSSLRQLIDDADFPIYVCRRESHELLYLNRRAAEIAQGEGSCIGEKCYKCIMRQDSPCEFCHMESLSGDRFQSFDFLRPCDGQPCKMQSKLIEWNGQSAAVNYILTQELPEEQRRQLPKFGDAALPSPLAAGGEDTVANAQAAAGGGRETPTPPLTETGEALETAKAALAETVERDPLTGALCCAAFARRVDGLIKSSQKTHHALIMLNMDGLKPLNDEFGHAAGDDALNEITAVIHSFTRKDDLVCRLEGDEFLVFLQDIPYDAVISRITRQMCEHIRKEYSARVHISANAGIAVCPRDGADYATLFSSARSALRRVMQGKTSDCAFFSADGEQEGDRADVKLPAVRQGEQGLKGTNRRILIADDDEKTRSMLRNSFMGEYQIETARNGAEAMARLRRFGLAISLVLLDLNMPVLDGFAVLKRMQNDTELRTVPVIVVTGDAQHNTLLEAMELGAAEYVTKPVDMELLRTRMHSVISKAENERLRAQNSYLSLQRDEEVKYRTVLESTGTVVVEYDCRNNLFIYDNAISDYILGKYDHRSLWQILLSDMVADSADVKTLQGKLFDLANGKGAKQDSMMLMLKTPEKTKHFFRVNIYKREDEYGLAEKLIMTFNDVHEEILANKRLLFQATRDELTGLYNRSGFIERATELIREKEAGYYMIASLDIDKFKVINDQFGTSKGDEILQKFALLLDGLFHGENGLCGRIMADDFAVLYPASLLDSPEFEKLHDAVNNIDNDVPTMRFAVGRCVVNDLSLDVSALYDRAAIARNTVKGRYDSYIATFDKSMRAEILRQQAITGQMNRALERGEFEIWLQPQFNHVSEKLSGAEALVRWRHPEKGLVSPAEFIPIFERNGFIYDMDRYVWEQTCKLLRKWLDRGLDCVPVSVNVSRYDILHGDILGNIEALVKKYEIPRELLCLEVTESAFSADSDGIIKVVQSLVDAGYTVEIDDFGSGYSSLNTLKDVPAQVLKMDMRFLENEKNAQRGGSIIESVVRMAKWLGMTVIAEGVETLQQADYLKSIGCKYIQGYLYSRPTQVEDYEKLFADGHTDAAFNRPDPKDTWNNSAFWNPASMETLIFNSYVGGACIFEYFEGKTELLRYNDDYAEIFHDGFHFDRRDTFSDIFAVLDRENAKIFENCIKSALDTKKEAVCEIQLEDDGEKHIIIRATLRQIAQAGRRCLFYCVVSDVTRQRDAEKAQIESTKRLELLMANISGGVSVINVDEDGSTHIAFCNDRYYELFGYTRPLPGEEQPDLMALVEPEDRKAVLSKVSEMEPGSPPALYTCQIRRKDGKKALLQASATVLDLERYGHVLVSILTDITKQRSLEVQLKALVENISGGFSAVYEKDGALNFVAANRQFFHILGYKDQEEYEKYCADRFSLVHPDDRERVETLYRSIGGGKDSYTMEYRIVRRDGAVRYVRSKVRVVSLLDIDEPVQLSVLDDVTAEEEAYEQLRFLSNSAHEILAQSDSEKAIAKTLEDVLEYCFAQRAFVFEINRDTHSSRNSYEICAPGVHPRTERLKSLKGEIRQPWMDALKKDGFVVVSDVSKMSDEYGELRQNLTEQGVHSFILAPLWRESMLVGFMGVDNPAKNLTRIERLPAVADFLTMLLTRRDLIQKIDQDSQKATQLMNDTPGGFVRLKLGKSGRFIPIFSNEGFRKLIGYSHEQLQSKYGQDILGGIHPDDLETLLAAQGRMLSGGATESARFRVLSSKGEYIWLSMYGRTSEDENGDVFMNVYFSDVSRQVSNEQTQKDLLDNLPCGAALYEFDGNELSVVHINKTYWQLVGREPVDYSAGLAVLDATHPDDRDITRREVQSAVEQGRNVLVNIRVINGDGDYTPFRVEAKIVRKHDGKYLLFASYTPISHSEMSLQEMFPVALSTLMSSSEDYSFVKDKSMRYVCCSRASAKFLGYDDEKELLGKTDMELSDDVQNEMFIDQDQRVLRTGEPIIDLEEKLRSVDGTVHTICISKYPITDASGNVFGLYCTARDITAQREAESQLKLLTDSIPGGLVTYECTGGDVHVIYYNSGCRKLFNLPEEGEIDTRLLNPRDYVFEEDRDFLYKAFLELVKNGKDMDCIYRVRLKDKRVKWIHIKAALSDRHGDTALINAVLFDITELQEEREQLRIAEEEYRIAMRQGKRTFGHFNVATKTLKLSGEAVGRLGLEETLENVPYSQISGGRISESTAHIYEDFYKEIIGGEKECTATFQKFIDGEWRWYTVHATTLFGDDGRPVSAVLSYEDATEQQEKEAVYGKWQQSLKERPEQSYTLFRCNLSQNTSLDSREGKLLTIVFSNELYTFDERIHEYANRFVFPADRQSYLAFLNADRLLAEYHRNQRSKVLEYRELCENSGYRWLRLTVDLVEYPNSRDVQGYLMYEDIDDEKRRTLEVIERAETDPLTGILNRSTFIARVEELLEYSNGGDMNALLMLDIDNFKQINDTLGHAAGDRVLKEVTEKISAILRRGDLMGRLGGDEFFVFMHGISDKHDASVKAAQICALPVYAGEGHPYVTGSIGIAISPDDGTNFDALYKSADNALYKQKKNGKNGFVFADKA